MSREVQLKRLLEIDRLIRAGRAPSPQMLAERLGVKTRQIYLDRRQLIEHFGAPLVLDRARGGWVYTDATFALPSAVLSETELLAFHLLVVQARASGNEGLSAPFDGAVTKLTHGLDERAAVDLQALNVSPAPAARSDDGHLLQLAKAQAARRKVRMLYFSAQSDEVKWRMVHPLGLENRRGEVLLIAFDENRAAVRSFNVARIRELRPTRAYFSPPEGFDIETFRRTMLWAEAGAVLHSIAVRFDAYQARYIQERQFHPDQTLEHHPDGALTLRFPASGLPEVARWVLGYGRHAEALAPPELRALVRDHVRQMTTLYEENYD